MQGDDERRARPTRRDVMVAAGASALALPTGAGLTQEPATASGVVFHDRSGSGLRRTGDPGVGGVMVSNGRDVVLTDADGRWRLPVSDGDSVFVIKPPHWSVPTAKTACRTSRTGIGHMQVRSPTGDPTHLPQRSIFRLPAAKKTHASKPCSWRTPNPRMTQNSPICETTSSRPRSAAALRSRSITATSFSTTTRFTRVTCRCWGRRA